MTKFVICLRNTSNPASLIVGKVYRVLPDPQAERQGLVRILDEDISEPEGYLYPEELFAPVQLPEVAERILLGVRT